MENFGKKGVFEAKVVSNCAVRRCYWRVTFELDALGSELFSQAMPGQFGEFDLSRVSLPAMKDIPAELLDSSRRQILLRRPFSFSDVRVVSDNPPAIHVEVLYCVLGPGTLRMSALKVGDTISVIGPLGNGFSIREDKKLAILIAGGMGSPPMQHLAEYLREKCPDTKVVVFAGARSFDDFPFVTEAGEYGVTVPVEFGRLGDEAYVTTDDGSAGYHGYVTGCVEEWLSEHSIDEGETIIYSCGPEVMLSEVAKLADRHGIDCEVSMERMMACGVGLCQSCAVGVKAGAEGETVYKLCCKDGPVFDSKDVSFRLQ